jgi:FkbM family methyltransferase
MKLTNDKQLFMPDAEMWHRWGASYEKDKFKKCMEYAEGKPKRLALDIGAHIGIWTRRLSNLYDSVICFEPCADHIECHKRNCSTITNTTLYEHALGSKEETLDMKVIVGRGGTNSFHYGKQGKTRMYEHKIVPMKVQSLDHYGLDNVDFMKIDIESHELEMLKGAVETLERCNPIIFIEDPTYFYNQKNNKKDPTGLDFLCNLGYTVDQYLGTYNYLLVRNRSE